MIRRVLAAGIAIGVLMVCVASSLAAAQTANRPGRVVLVAVPRLEWADLGQGDSPVLDAFMQQSATALLSVRAIGPFTGTAEGYVTIGAGNRATIRAAQVRPIVPTGDGGGVTYSMRAARIDADRKLYDAEPGALGSAVRGAGLTTALVGGPAAAALAIADEAGRIDRVVASDAPLPDADVTVVTLDALEQLESRRGVVTYQRSGDPATSDRRRAVAELDTRVAELLAQTDGDDLVLVAAPSALGDRGRLTVFAMRGPDVVPGAARSATTRRAHYVTLPDLAPTIVSWLGIEQPAAMNGTPITGGHGDAGAPAWLADRAERALYRDRTVGPASVVYIVAQVLTYAAVAFAVGRGHRRVLRAAVGAALAILAFPSVAFLSGLVAYRRLPLPGYIVALVVASIALAVAVTRRATPVTAAVVLVALGWAVQVVDIVTGGELQLDTPFGYSPIVAGRFQGFGNLSFSLLGATALVVMTAHWPGPGDPKRRVALWASVAVASITLVADGLPRLGADVGGVLAFFPAAAVTLLVLTGRRVSLTRLTLLAGAAAAVLGGFAAFDLQRPVAERTHLARFATRLFDGEAGSILRRKLAANLHILTSSVWTWLMPVALVFLAVVMTRPRGALAALQRTVPGVRAALAGSAVLALLGFALNDSGIAIPAMMCGVLLPWLVVLVGEQQR